MHGGAWKELQAIRDWTDPEHVVQETSTHQQRGRCSLKNKSDGRSGFPGSFPVGGSTGRILRNTFAGGKAVDKVSDRRIGRWGPRDRCLLSNSKLPFSHRRGNIAESARKTKTKVIVTAPPPFFFFPPDESVPRVRIPVEWQEKKATTESNQLVN